MFDFYSSPCPTVIPPFCKTPLMSQGEATPLCPRAGERFCSCPTAPAPSFPAGDVTGAGQDRDRGSVPPRAVIKLLKALSGPDAAKSGQGQFKSQHGQPRWGQPGSGAGAECAPPGGEAPNISWRRLQQRWIQWCFGSWKHLRPSLVQATTAELHPCLMPPNQP